MEKEIYIKQLEQKINELNNEINNLNNSITTKVLLKLISNLKKKNDLLELENKELHNKLNTFDKKENLYDNENTNLKFWDKLDSNGTGFGYELSYEYSTIHSIYLQWGYYQNYILSKGIILDLIKKFKNNKDDDDDDDNNNDDVNNNICNLKQNYILFGHFYNSIFQGYYTHIELNIQTNSFYYDKKITKYISNDKKEKIIIYQDNYILKYITDVEQIIIESNNNICKSIFNDNITIFSNNYIVKLLKRGIKLHIMPDNSILKLLLNNNEITISNDDCITKKMLNSEKIIINSNNNILKNISNDLYINIYPDNCITKYISPNKQIHIKEDDFIVKYISNFEVFNIKPNNIIIKNVSKDVRIKIAIDNSIIKYISNDKQIKIKSDNNITTSIFDNEQIDETPDSKILNHLNTITRWQFFKFVNVKCITNFISNLTLIQKKQLLYYLLFKYKNGTINTFLVEVFKKNKEIVEKKKYFITNKFNNILHLLFYNKININELLNNVILCYNVTTTGYPYPYENNINVYNDFRKIKDLLELFDNFYDTQLKTGKNQNFKIMKNNGIPDNLFIISELTFDDKTTFLDFEEYYKLLKQYISL